MTQKMPWLSFFSKMEEIDFLADELHQKKGKTPSAQSQPMAFLIVILSIALISTSLLQHHLGTCDCTSSIRTK